MQCERLEIVNFCQHAYREHVFELGLTAIMGPNGAGKSNFLGAIRFALTGQNPNIGNKLENINALAHEKAPSYVKLTFTHGPARVTVQRNLRPAKPTALLTWEGGGTIEGDTAVTAAIEDLLGISAELLNDVIIVSQDNIFSFLERAPAKRAALFQRLFNTQKSETIYAALGDHLNSLTIPEVGMSADECRKRIMDAQAQIQQLQEQLAPLPALAALQQQQTVIHRIETAIRERASVVAELEELATRLAKNQEEMATAQADSATSQQELTQLQQKAADAETAWQAIEQQLQTWKQKEIVATARENTQKQYTQCQQQIDEVTARRPAQPDGPKQTTEQLRVRLQDVYSELQQCATFLKNCDCGVTECPTCGTATEVLQPKIDQYRADRVRLEQEYAEIQTQHAVWQAYETQQQKLTAELAAYYKNLHACSEMLANCPEEPDWDVETWRQIQQTHAEVGQLRHKSHAAAQAAVNRQQATAAWLNTMQQTYAYHTERRAALSAKLGELPEYTQEDLLNAQAAYAQIDAGYTHRIALEQTCGIQQAIVLENQNMLREILAAQENAVKIKAWRDHAYELRGLFHKDVIPRFVAQRNLEQLQQVMQQYLEIFNADYRVVTDSNLSFTAIFTNGVSQPAYRLSRGQKMILTFVFLLALNQLFAANIGALYLDEPTANVDDHHIQELAPVFDRLKMLSDQCGLQCFIITHDRTLEPLFNTVISL